MDSQKIYSQVQEYYGSLAKSSGLNNSHTIAKAFGYSKEELKSTPVEANLGVSCGNPLAIAGLREGETVVDLGSGAGFDVFQASKQVGPSGRVFGVDMNKDMLERAAKNKAKISANNVEFVESRITSTRLDSGIADCIISNCVVNLVPEEEKAQVFHEIFRLLKSGGRVAISDILARKPFAAEIQRDVGLYCGCIAGASTVEVYTEYLSQAGFKEILIVDSGSDLNVYAASNPEALACCAPSVEKSSKSNSKQGSCCIPSQASCGSESKDSRRKGGLNECQRHELDLNELAGSYKIFGVKH